MASQSGSLVDNVIPACFDPKFKMEIFTSIKYVGIKRTHKEMLDAGFHPSFVRALVRNITRTMGW